MPGSDASQFTRFKKASAVQRGDTQQSNRLTQYVPKLTGASCQTLFLDSLMPKGRRALCNNQGGGITELDFAGVEGSYSLNNTTVYELFDPPITPNNDFYFKIINFTGGYANILSIRFFPSKGETIIFKNSFVEVIGSGTYDIDTSLGLVINVTGFNKNSILHITFPEQISIIGNVAITISGGGGGGGDQTDDLNTTTRIFDFDGIHPDKGGDYLLQNLTFNENSGKYNFTFKNVDSNPDIAEIQLGSTAKFPTGGIFSINGVNVTPSGGSNTLIFAINNLKAANIILRVRFSGLLIPPFQFDSLSLVPVAVEVIEPTELDFSLLTEDSNNQYILNISGLVIDNNIFKLIKTPADDFFERIRSIKLSFQDMPNVSGTLLDVTSGTVSAINETSSIRFAGITGFNSNSLINLTTNVVLTQVIVFLAELPVENVEVDFIESKSVDEFAVMVEDLTLNGGRNFKFSLKNVENDPYISSILFYSPINIFQGVSVIVNTRDTPLIEPYSIGDENYYLSITFETNYPLSSELEVSILRFQTNIEEIKSLTLGIFFQKLSFDFNGISGIPQTFGTEYSLEEEKTFQKFKDFAFRFENFAGDYTDIVGIALIGPELLGGTFLVNDIPVVAQDGPKTNNDYTKFLLFPAGTFEDSTNGLLIRSLTESINFIKSVKLLSQVIQKINRIDFDRVEEVKNNKSGTSTYLLEKESTFNLSTDPNFIFDNFLGNYSDIIQITLKGTNLSSATFSIDNYSIKSVVFSTSDGTPIGNPITVLTFPEGTFKNNESVLSIRGLTFGIESFTSIELTTKPPFSIDFDGVKGVKQPDNGNVYLLELKSTFSSDTDFRFFFINILEEYEDIIEITLRGLDLSSTIFTIDKNEFEPEFKEKEGVYITKITFPAGTLTKKSILAIEKLGSNMYYFESVAFKTQEPLIKVIDFNNDPTKLFVIYSIPVGVATNSITFRYINIPPNYLNTELASNSFNFEVDESSLKINDQDVELQYDNPTRGNYGAHTFDGELKDDDIITLTTNTLIAGDIYCSLIA